MELTTLVNVALRKESVDRNSFNPQQWHLAQVALRKESVDRNPENPMIGVNKIPSLSARRAWIEMPEWAAKGVYFNVALRKESVDRNFNTVQIEIVKMRRSPQGERG